MTCLLCQDTGIIACHGTGNGHDLPGPPLEPSLSWVQVETRVRAVFGELSEQAEKDPLARMVWERYQRLWILTSEHKIVPGGCHMCPRGEHVASVLWKHHQLKKTYYQARTTSLDGRARGLADWSFSLDRGPFQSPSLKERREAAQAALKAAQLESVWAPYAQVWSETLTGKT